MEGLALKKNMEQNNEVIQEKEPEKSLYQDKYLIPISIFVSGLLIAGSIFLKPGTDAATGKKGTDAGGSALSAESADVHGSTKTRGSGESFILPIKWGDLGARMVSTGIIDYDKFKQLYESRGGFTKEEKKFLESSFDGDIVITEDNNGFFLNVLWALGLGNKNTILENGPMSSKQYESPGIFASVGGWTLARGSATEHFSRHPLIPLTPDQQLLVERVSKNIYRPCCNNSTYFPDCNHGMAMLGLLELMASQGVSEEDMYKVALRMNRLWFPDTYDIISQYLAEKKSSLLAADPKEILGASYSSAGGYRKILEKFTPKEQDSGGGGGGGGCGVDAGVPSSGAGQIKPPSKSQPVGCGV